MVDKTTGAKHVFEVDKGDYDERALEGCSG
jgi:hypothetical protein